MGNSYKGGIKHYVINLDRETKRWQHIKEQFDRLGLEPIRISAVDGRNLNVSDLNHYRRGVYRLLYDTELACFLSHRRVWKIIAEGTDEFACVFEDDAFLSRLLPDFLAKRPWPEHIELLSLEQFDKILLCVKDPVWQEDGYQIYRNLDYNPGTAGYLLSKRFAKILLKHSEIFHHLVDAYMFNPRRYIAHHYKAYQITPALCVQGYNNADMSDNHHVPPTNQEFKSRFSDKALFLKKTPLYYWRRVIISLCYNWNKRKGVPVQIDFIE